MKRCKCFSSLKVPVYICQMELENKAAQTIVRADNCKSEPNRHCDYYVYRASGRNGLVILLSINYSKLIHLIFSFIHMELFRAASVHRQLRARFRRWSLVFVGSLVGTFFGSFTKWKKKKKKWRKMNGVIDFRFKANQVDEEHNSAESIVVVVITELWKIDRRRRWQLFIDKRDGARVREKRAFCWIEVTTF